MKHIKDIPDFDRPREKLAAKGPEALSDSELIAILLGSGVKGKDVFQVARPILQRLDKYGEKTDIKALVAIDVEAANFAIRHSVKAHSFYQRKKA